MSTGWLAGSIDVYGLFLPHRLIVNPHEVWFSICGGPDYEPPCTNPTTFASWSNSFSLTPSDQLWWPSWVDCMSTFHVFCGHGMQMIIKFLQLIPSWMMIEIHRYQLEHNDHRGPSLHAIFQFFQYILCIISSFVVMMIIIMISMYCNQA